MAPLIASLCQNRGLDPNMVAAMMNNNRGNGGWGDGSAWWIIILLIFGWGGFGNGFGGGFGGRGSAQGLADLGNLVNNDAGRELLMSAIQGNGTAISQLASTVHCDVNALQGAIANVSQSICQLGNQMGQNTNQVLTAIMQGNNSILSQLCDCCCSIKGAITEQGYQGQLRTIQQTQDIIQNGESVLVISCASSPAQFLNSLVHELHHMASHIASALGYDQKGEDACYIAGEAAEKMYPVASKYLCEHCRNH